LRFTSIQLGKALSGLRIFWFGVESFKLSCFGYRSDVVEIETWCQSEGRIGTRRDWILKDCATGEVIGRATRF
jgi:hypothetical protein